MSWYNTFTLLISMLSTFLSSSFFVLFQSVFHYWELYKQFEYRIAISRFKTSSLRNETRRTNSIFRSSYRRDQVISPLYFNAAGEVPYVTSDHLHRYWKPTARNIASRDLRMHRQIRRRLFTPSGLCSRAKSIMRVDLSAKSKAPRLSGNISYAQLRGCFFLSIKPPWIARD